MFTANHFGGNGDPANNNCVGTGLAAGWVPVQGPNSGTCLKRCNDWKVLYSPESVAALIGTGDDYNTFHASIQGGPHTSVHNQMGGSCGDFSSGASSNDPVFFLHHAMVRFLLGVGLMASYQHCTYDSFTNYNNRLTRLGGCGNCRALPILNWVLDLVHILPLVISMYSPPPPTAFVIHTLSRLETLPTK